MVPELDELSEQAVTKTTLSPDKSCYCWQCGYEWRSRKTTSPPAVCPRCRSDIWNKHRRFKCNKCGHVFLSGNLNADAYSLFPSCPNCHSFFWHKQLEKEKQRETKRKQELTEYLRQVELLRRHSFIRILRLIILIALFSLLLFSYVGIMDTSTQLTQDTRIMLVNSLGVLIITFFLTYKYPRERVLNSYKLSQLATKKLITTEEAEWIRVQFPVSKSAPRKLSPHPGIQSHKSLPQHSGRRPDTSKGKSSNQPLNTIVTVFSFLVVAPVYISLKIFIWALKFLFKRPRFLLSALLPIDVDIE